VDWVDDPDSRVDIAATVLADLRGVWRLGRALATGALPVGTLRRQFGRARCLPACRGYRRAWPGRRPGSLLSTALTGCQRTGTHAIAFRPGTDRNSAGIRLASSH